METSVDTLNILLRAAYPVIYVVSHEESRVESALEELIAKRNAVNGSATELWNWSFTEGSRCISGNNGSEFPEQDPADVLEFIGSTESPQFSFYETLVTFWTSPREHNRMLCNVR